MVAPPLMVARTRSEWRNVMAQHTEGPWGVEVNNQEARIHGENFKHTIGWVSSDYVTEDGRETLSAEGRANAKPIAAAPEMLAEPRRVREHFAGCSHCSGTEAAVWNGRLSALIAKAEAK